MNAYVPFICLAAGAAINWRGLPPRILRLFDAATDLALIVLMLVIGLNIGTSEKVMSNLGVIGFNCLVISLSAIAVSVLLVLLAEKTIMPLEEIRLKLAEEKGDDQSEPPSTGFSPLIVIMPLCIAAGIILGYLVFSDIPPSLLDTVLTVSLVFLYTGVGVSIGSNKEVFSYIRKLGLRIIFMPAAIFTGCIAGGFLSGLILGVPAEWSVCRRNGLLQPDGSVSHRKLRNRGGDLRFHSQRIARRLYRHPTASPVKDKQRQPHRFGSCRLYGYYVGSRH